MIRTIQSACCTNRCVSVNVSDYIPLAVSINKYQCLVSLTCTTIKETKVSARDGNVHWLQPL
jgi:hypothetical protein